MSGWEVQGLCQRQPLSCILYNRIAYSGAPLSPQSAAKLRHEHCLVKDRRHGFRCLNCGDKGMDVAVIKSSKCASPTKDSPVAPKHTNQATLEARLAELQALEAEGNMLMQLLQAEHQKTSAEDLVLQQQQLAELAMLEQEEAMLLQAQVDSLETAAAEARFREEQHDAKRRKTEMHVETPAALDATAAKKSKEAAATAEQDVRMDIDDQKGLAGGEVDMSQALVKAGHDKGSMATRNKQEKGSDIILKSKDEIIEDLKQLRDESENIAKSLLFQPNASMPSGTTAHFHVCFRALKFLWQACEPISALPPSDACKYKDLTTWRRSLCLAWTLCLRPWALACRSSIHSQQLQAYRLTLQRMPLVLQNRLWPCTCRALSSRTRKEIVMLEACAVGAQSIMRVRPSLNPMTFGLHICMAVSCFVGLCAYLLQLRKCWRNAL